MDLSEDQKSIAEDYADNSFTPDLISYIGSSVELDRLNNHRGTEWGNLALYHVIKAALDLRLEDQEISSALLLESLATLKLHAHQKHKSADLEEQSEAVGMDIVIHEIASLIDPGPPR